MRAAPRLAQRGDRRSARRKDKAANKDLPTNCVGPGWMLMVTGGPFCLCPPCCTARMRLGLATATSQRAGCAERPAVAGPFLSSTSEFGGAESAEMDRGKERRGEERTRGRSVALGAFLAAGESP